MKLNSIGTADIFKLEHFFKCVRPAYPFQYHGLGTKYVSSKLAFTRKHRP